jgi:hypothetical protein
MHPGTELNFQEEFSYTNIKRPDVTLNPKSQLIVWLDAL